MGTPPLTSGTERRIDLLFPENRREAVRKLLLEQCGNKLPFLGRVDSTEMDRFRFAVLKLSGGDWEKLQKAVELAKRDWRDLLVAAGFANDPESHTAWLPE